jgi:hypothetical protein
VTCYMRVREIWQSCPGFLAMNEQAAGAVALALAQKIEKPRTQVPSALTAVWRRTTRVQVRKARAALAFVNMPPPALPRCATSSARFRPQIHKCAEFRGQQNIRLIFRRVVRCGSISGRSESPPRPRTADAASSAGPRLVGEGRRRATPGASPRVAAHAATVQTSPCVPACRQQIDSALFDTSSSPLARARRPEGCCRWRRGTIVRAAFEPGRARGTRRGESSAKIQGRD